MSTDGDYLINKEIKKKEKGTSIENVDKCDEFGINVYISISYNIYICN